MKRFLVLLFVCALIAAMSLTAFAATGINKYEQIVLNKLQGGVIVTGEGKTYSIPQAYINSARNYFLGDYDMTEDEMNRVLSYIKAGEGAVQGEANVADKEFSLSDVSDATKSEVVKMGQEACEEVGLKLNYSPSSNKIVITSKDGNRVFESSSAIKATGEDFTLNAGSVCTAIVVVMVLGCAVMFGISKKNGLLV